MHMASLVEVPSSGTLPWEIRSGLSLVAFKDETDAPPPQYQPDDISPGDGIITLTVGL